MIGRMGFLTTILVAIGAAGGVMALHRRAMSRARNERDRALAAAAAARRAADLAAGDLRDGTLRMLGELEHLADRQTDGVAGVVACLRQLVGLADDLLDQSVLDRPERALRIEPVPLDRAVQDALATVAAMLQPGRRHWRVAPGVDGHTVLADRRALMQVLVRVLGNAAWHSAPDDWIEIHLREHGGELELCVDDEGNGLGAPVRQEDRGQPESRGRGLGLTLARRLMEAHGGSMTVESATQVGTRVILRFPAELVARQCEAAV